MKDNKLIIAVAGSGKTQYLAEEALSIKGKNVLITTFTESNRDEIIKKILEKKKYIPTNIVIQTWISFLLQHGVRPYQSVIHPNLHSKRIGFFLNQGQSTMYSSESNIFKHYFTKDLKIYSDKISKFTARCNENSQGEVISRISRIFPYIFIDEVQDLAGWDLEVLKLLLQSSSKIIMVGDPRQAIYDTNDSPKYKKYRGSGIQNFIKEECKNLCTIDTKTLTTSHRNNEAICKLSSKLYPELPESKPCSCTDCRNVKVVAAGIFLVRKKDVKSYIKSQSSIQLRLNVNTKDVLEEFKALNFGISKGLSFDSVIIYPTDNMRKWIINNNQTLVSMTRAQFYVAITRARYNVGIVYDFNESVNVEGIEKYDPSNN